MIVAKMNWYSVGAAVGLYGGTLGRLVLSLYRQMKLSPER